MARSLQVLGLDLSILAAGIDDRGDDGSPGQQSWSSPSFLALKPVRKRCTPVRLPLGRLRRGTALFALDHRH